MELPNLEILLKTPVSTLNFKPIKIDSTKLYRLNNVQSALGDQENKIDNLDTVPVHFQTCQFLDHNFMSKQSFSLSTHLANTQNKKTNQEEVKESTERENKSVHFDTSSASLVNEIMTAIKVYAYGVEDFTADPENKDRSLNTQLSCEGVGAARWDTGDRFFRYLKNVSVEGDQGKPNLEFTQDGVLRSAELKIMNLRPGVSKQLVWEEIGVWKSWQKQGLDIKDIVWPGNSHTPPQGVPEKFHLKITFLEEPPYINLAPPDPVTGKCSMDRGVLCRVATDADITE
ncbi:unnamed protein product [Diabrotica balteata]|uniref:Uncharacterized protein n=1 Tax=Diabrotica balteata TaxID=107213 RepID=A0A9N9T8H1_DIABA|nr:unnamed protein product [Diabrotica balteata]